LSTNGERGSRTRRYHRPLRCEPLEPRHLLSVGPFNAGAGFGVAGDSLSDEYDDTRSGASYVYAENWVELLAEHKSFDFGPRQSTKEPRLDGYAYNWARYGATSSTLLSRGQHTGLARQIRSGLVDQAVLMIGQNDFLPGLWGSAYFEIYMGTWNTRQIARYADKVVRNIETAIKTINVHDVQLVVSDICDYGVAPITRQFFTDWTKRERVTKVITGVNARIEQLAQRYGIPMVDFFALSKRYLGTNESPVDSRVIGGVTITNDGGVEGNHAFVDDDAHPHTVIQAAFANMFLEAFNEGYGGNTPLFSEREMVELAGLTYTEDTLKLDFSEYVVLPKPILISISDATVSEPSSGQTKAVFTVSLSAPTAKPVTVHWSTLDGSAKAGADYRAVDDAVLRFVPGQTRKNISVAVKADPTQFGEETFSVQLANPTNAALADDSGTGTILLGPVFAGLNEQFKTMAFTAPGTVIVSGVAEQSAMTLNGTVVFDGPTRGRFSAKGSGDVSTDSGTSRVSTSFANMAETSGVLRGDVKVATNPYYRPENGTFSGMGSFSTADFSMSMDFGWASWSGTLVPQGVQAAEPFDIRPSKLVRKGNNIAIGFAVGGPPLNVADATRSTPVSEVAVSWAGGPNAGDILPGGLIGVFPVYWNEAGATVILRNILYSPPGATHLLVVADPGNRVEEGAAGEANNVLALHL
jgi:lysophospholipase L1-like esterase